MKTRIVFPALLIALMCVVACKKQTTEANLQSATDNELAMRESNNVVDAVNGVGMNPADAQRLAFGGHPHPGMQLPDCAVVTVDTVRNPRVITIDFGTSNCLCSEMDGKYRRGKIIATYSGRYEDAGTVIHMYTEDYYVNDYLHVFDKTVTNLGVDHDGYIEFSIHATGNIATEAGNITWNSDRTRIWIAGFDTHNDCLDDVYEVTGGATGVDRNGDAFTMTITSPLRRELDCRWIVSGTMEITIEGKPTRTIDFGNGDCDSQATGSCNGHSRVINL